MDPVLLDLDVSLVPSGMQPVVLEAELDLEHGSPPAPVFHNQTGVPQEIDVIVPLGSSDLPRIMTLAIPDSVVDQAPSSITVYVSGAPVGDVRLYIDGELVNTGANIGIGIYGPTSLSVEKMPPANTTYYPAGVHTVTASADDAIDVSADFTITNPPPNSGWIITPDADPVSVPAAESANGTFRWVFQDLMPGGLGSWVMQHNPATMSALPIDRNVSADATTTGVVLLTESLEQPHQFSFAGRTLNQVEHDKLLQYAGLRRRWYLIDHRNRAWIFTFSGIDLKAKKRFENTSDADYYHDYTAKGFIYSRDWKVPA